MKSSDDVPVRGDSEIFREAIEAQLNRGLASEFFRSSARHQLLLRTIYKESVAGRPEALKEIVLAKEVFERPEYDPRRDTLVRVEANAVRRKLAEYYEQSGAKDRIRIDIPLAHYVAVFSPLPAEPEEHANAQQDPRR